MTAQSAGAGAGAGAQVDVDAPPVLLPPLLPLLLLHCASRSIVEDSRSPQCSEPVPDDVLTVLVPPVLLLWLLSHGSASDQFRMLPVRQPEASGIRLVVAGAHCTSQRPLPSTSMPSVSEPLRLSPSASVSTKPIFSW